MKQDTYIFLNRRSLFQVLWFLKIIRFVTVQRVKSCPPDVVSIAVTLDLTHSTMELSTHRPESSDNCNLGYIQCTLTCTLLPHSRCTCIVGIKTGLLCQFYSGHEEVYLQWAELHLYVKVLKCSNPNCKFKRKFQSSEFQ